MKLYKIKKSNIDRNGRGLYATKDIKEGTRIIDYVGKIITKKQTEESEKFDNWFLECREINKKEKCELVQVLSVKDTNIKFKLLYNIFKNQDGKLKEVFNIVTPLGVNLIVNPAFRFDGGKQYNSRYIKCEI